MEVSWGNTEFLHFVGRKFINSKYISTGLGACIVVGLYSATYNMYNSKINNRDRDINT